MVFIRPRDGRIQADDVIHAVNQDTLLVSVMAVNNETGERLPVEEIAGGVKRKIRMSWCIATACRDSERFCSA